MLQQLVLPIRLTTIKAASIFFISLLLAACTNKVKNSDLQTKLMDTTFTVKMATSINSMIKPELADGLKLSVWGIDSLVISPIAIDIDDNGKLYYATTNRQKNSEFDIRGHTSWEIESIQLQTVEEKRIFLHKELSPENSSKNEWLKDLNGDKSHDWKDMTIEKENIYRLEDRNGDGVADQSQLVVNDFNDEVTDVVGGVLSEGDNLYVAVAPDLWRMKDKNGDGIADEKTSISNGYGIHIGFGGHGMSGIEMGPDGKIYWQIGDIGFNGKGQDGEVWNHANSGVIARANPDGSDFEIFAAGLRNTHEFAFDEYGNLISEDNDGDHAGERERLVYIVNGSDAGWRSNWQYGKYRDAKNNLYKVWMDEKMYLPRFEGQAAYITPCISNFVSGPAGFVYNPGTALGPEYYKTFFVAEFVGSPNNSGIHAFKLTNKGASFELGEHKKIVGGILPTGLDFGPDGALYTADWIEGWETHNFGRIWKLDTKETPASPLRIKTKQLLASDFTKNSDIELAELLKNPDMRVRLKAQFELVKRGEKGYEQLLGSMKQTNNQLARVHGIWGMAQLTRQQKKYGLSLMPLLSDSDAEIRAQSAKWLGDIKYQEA
ncbi:MAG: heme-binding protein, partial [Chitinophagaceae bacterium]